MPAPMRLSRRTRSGLSLGISRKPSSPLEAVVNSISGESKIRWNAVVHVLLVID